MVGDELASPIVMRAFELDQALPTVIGDEGKGDMLSLSSHDILLFTVVSVWHICFEISLIGILGQHTRPGGGTSE